MDGCAGGAVRRGNGGTRLGNANGFPVKRSRSGSPRRVLSTGRASIRFSISEKEQNMTAETTDKLKGDYSAYLMRCENRKVDPLNFETWRNAQHWYVRIPPSVEVTDRPQLGEWCEISATGHKADAYSGESNRIWQEWNNVPPFRAMYVGNRTVYDGYREWEDEVGYSFTPHSHREVWLFVRDARQNPIHAFPCSVKRL